MHFSVPDTTEVKDAAGSTHTVFNVHINGVYHCSVRYREFHNFHEQLKKEYSQLTLPSFPPKKLLSLSLVQLEERRALLERYIQILSQNPTISSSTSFNGFLLQAQQRSQREKAEQVSLDVYLMNGHKITASIKSTDQTQTVYNAVAAQIQLAQEYVEYFALFLVKKEEGAENAIVRKLQDFESPYISLKAAVKTTPHRIVIRKSFWDNSIEQTLMKDRIAMNLLYVQAVSDVGRGWVLANKDQHKQLKVLQDNNQKREYLDLARSLKYYGHVQFRACVCDYPEEDTKVIVYAGNKELALNHRSAKAGVTEHVFKVTRMRCWRITSSYVEGLEEAGTSNQNSTQAAPFKLELSFEYLIAKDTLKWITITSDQAILMSMCLQGMVDELISRKNAAEQNTDKIANNSRVSNGNSNPSDVTVHKPRVQKQNSQESRQGPNPSVKSSQGSNSSNPVIKRSISTVSQGLSGGENAVFERDDVIGDDDL